MDLPLFIADYLRSLEWEFTQNEEGDRLRFHARLDNCSVQCQFIVQQERDLVQFYCLYPVSAPEDLRLAVAEYITRANYGLVFGNFELDFRDGEIRYKTSMNTDGGALNLETLQHLVQSNFHVADHYFPGLMAVLYSDTEPAEAVSQLEA